MVPSPGTGSKETLFHVSEDSLERGLGPRNLGPHSWSCPVWVAQRGMTQFPLLYPTISRDLASDSVLRCEVCSLLGGPVLLSGSLAPCGGFEDRSGSKLSTRWGQLGALGGGNQNGEEVGN